MMKFDKDWVGLNFRFQASQARFRPIWASEGGFGSIWASKVGFSAILSLPSWMLGQFELLKLDFQLIWASHAGFGLVWVSWASQKGAWVTKWPKLKFRHEFIMKSDKDCWPKFWTSGLSG